MFTIEHEFDASVITLIDDNATPGTEDVTITCFDDSVTVEQLDSRTGQVMKVSLSMAQIEDLRAALDLPEGAYVRRPSAD
ncbi:MAG: hypothetical protein HUJ24_11340 [Rhodobacteraceae bacterium]|nr:hypothetical protein [Paracoccaceae bacterium]